MMPYLLRQTSKLTAKVSFKKHVIPGLLMAGIVGLMATNTSVETISGFVYLDYEEDRIENNHDWRHPVITVNIYDDADENGSLSTGDNILGSTVTDAEGNFSIDIDYSNTSISQRISSSSDDAEEEVDNGDVDDGSSDLEMFYDGGDHQLVGIRFASVNLPPAATITSASIRFTAKSSESDAQTITIKGEKNINAATFGESDYNISSRPTTTASVNWNTGSWSKNSSYTSDDITSIIREIIDQDGWVPGNAISFILSGSGSNTKNAYSGTSSGPELLISYSLPERPYILAIDTNSLASFTSVNEIALPKGSATNQALAFTGQPVMCYSVSDDGTDNLVYINRISGQSSFASGGGETGTSSIEAVAFKPDNMALYAADAKQLGTIDLQTGAFTALPNEFGKGDGSQNNIQVNDVDGLAFNPLTNELWGTHRQSSQQDMLIKIDPSTGLIIQDAFGAGVDYVQISGTNIQRDIDDLAIDPSTGKIYGINNGTYSYENIIEIDPTTGTATAMSPIRYNGAYLEDIEGFGFTNFGMLIATTGNSGDDATSDRLYEVDIATGTATLLGAFAVGADFEGCDCLVGAPNQLNGYIYTDQNNNQSFDNAEVPLENVKLWIYLDKDGNDSYGGSDERVDSVYTDATGYYEWNTGSNEDFGIQIDMTTAPENYAATGVSEREADFSSKFGGIFDRNNNMGLINSALLPVEWLYVQAEWQANTSVLQWATTTESNSDFFGVERSLDGSLFSQMGQIKAAGQSENVREYRFEDSDARYLQAPRIYYRLKQVDLDGQFAYSQVVELNALGKEQLMEMNVYPNPASDILNVRYSIPGVEDAQAKVYDLNGRLLQTETIAPGNGTLKLGVANWMTGIYFIKIETEDLQAQKRFIVR